MRSWKLGTAFGIGIYIHWTFLLLVGFMAYKDYEAGGSGLNGLLTLGIVFTCVVLHELGHALTARHYGIPTRDITLYPIGGVARLERMSERPWEEFWIALAGPAVNVAIIGLVALPLYFLVQQAAADLSTWAFLGANGLLAQLMFVNGMLVVFNMLPAFPMDGGRVFRALLVPYLGRLRATEVAATLGTVFAVLFVIAGLVFQNPMLLFIALFGRLAGQQELAAVRYAEQRRRMPPLYALPANDEVLDALPVPHPDAEPISPRPGQPRAWIVWREGRPLTTYWIE
jgi:Zn-dependent protease